MSLAAKSPARFRDGSLHDVFVVVFGLALGTVACADEARDDASLQGRGPLVSAFDEITACDLATYRGPETPLYSNRPYHTAAPVPRAEGLRFCRGARHGTNVWIVDVSQPTTFVAFGTQAFGLERRGWRATDDPLLIEAAGVSFDRVFTRRIEPGRYVIRQGFSSSAVVVLFEAASVTPAR